MTESNDKQPPHATIKYRAFELPIWRNEDAQGRVRYSTSTASKNYYDKQAQQWKRTSSFYSSENLVVSKLYSMADDRIAELEEADYQARKEVASHQAPNPEEVAV